MNYEFTVAIPTYNGGDLFVRVLQSINKQNLRPTKVLVVDSSSTDNTREKAEAFGCTVFKIRKDDFDHGATRNKMLELVDTPVVLFMTQDAILANENSFKNLVSVFKKDNNVGAAYGRQIPHDDANSLASFARHYSYPEASYICTMDSQYPRGFRKTFCSNSFAAYRANLLREVGGFSDSLILGEDALATAKMLKFGYKVAYCSDAIVKHSHNYSFFQEFKRYFDIGVFHESEKWMLDYFGVADGEGVKFAIRQLRYLLKNREFVLLPVSLIHSISKYLGYRLGRLSSYFPNRINQYFSMHKSYWIKR